MVLCQDEASTQECDDLLWSFEQLSFLPHQLKGDKCLLPQSIYITDQLADNHNQANVLAFYNPASSIPQGFTRVVYMFSNGEEHLSQEMIARLQQSSFPYSYFVQQADGSWAKKN
jgi:DNA polymerase IIIc chi subunit